MNVCSFARKKSVLLANQLGPDTNKIVATMAMSTFASSQYPDNKYGNAPWEQINPDLVLAANDEITSAMLEGKKAEKAILLVQKTMTFSRSK